MEALASRWGVQSPPRLGPKRDSCMYPLRRLKVSHADGMLRSKKPAHPLETPFTTSLVGIAFSRSGFSGIQSSSPLPRVSALKRLGRFGMGFRRSGSNT